MSTLLVLGVDIGGSNTGAWLAEDATGTVVSKKWWKTDRATPNNTLMALKLWVDGKLDANDAELVGVGVGAAAPLSDGVIGQTSNLYGWSDLPLRREFHMFHLPSQGCVVVDNDTIMAALGEYARCQESLCFLGVGTGVGFGVLRKPKGVAGRTCRIPEREATEGGHITIDVDSRLKCNCGAFGCLEALVGGEHLERRFNCRPEDATDAAWLPVLKDLAAGIRSLSATRLHLPFYLGGGVMDKQRHRFDLLCQLVNQRRNTADAPRLALATAGNNAGLEGAVYAARYLR